MAEVLETKRGECEDQSAGNGRDPIASQVPTEGVHPIPFIAKAIKSARLKASTPFPVKRVTGATTMATPRINSSKR